MKFVSRLFLGVFLAFSIQSPLIAQVQVVKNIDSWHLIRRLFHDRENSCQAIQCSRSVCGGLDKYFLLVTAPKLKYTVPEFNYGRMVEWATQVKLVIGKKTFILENRTKKPDSFLSPLNGRDLTAINRSLLALEKAQPSAKFYVIDTNGYKRPFAVRGTYRVLKEFNRTCSTPLP